MNFSAKIRLKVCLLLDKYLGCCCCFGELGSSLLRVFYFSLFFPPAPQDKRVTHGFESRYVSDLDSDSSSGCMRTWRRTGGSLSPGLKYLTLVRLESVLKKWYLRADLEEDRVFFVHILLKLQFLECPLNDSWIFAGFQILVEDF